MAALVVVYSIGILITIILSAFFSGFETAVISANRLKLKNLEMDGDYQAEEALKLLKDAQKVIAVTLVGNNITIVIASLLSREIFKIVIPQESGFLNLSPDAIEQIANLLILTPIFLIFAEVIPKQISRVKADRVVMSLTWLFKIFAFFFVPVARLINGIIYLLLKPIGISPKAHTTKISKEDIRNIVGDGIAPEEDQASDAETFNEKEMIHGIFNLEKTRVCEVMRPLVSLAAARLEDSTIDGVMALAKKTGHSRIPVFRERVVNIVGYVDIFRIFSEYNKTQKLEDFVEEAPYVPESKRIDDLLQDFIKSEKSVAVVVDEYGGCSGWVHIKDLLEEIVGEIQDEVVHEEKEFKRLTEDTYEVSGAMDIDDLNSEIPINIEKHFCETLGGYIYAALGKIPHTGERVFVRNYVLEVTKMEGRRILKVKISRHEKQI